MNFLKTGQPVRQVQPYATICGQLCMLMALIVYLATLDCHLRGNHLVLFTTFVSNRTVCIRKVLDNTFYVDCVMYFSGLNVRELFSISPADHLAIFLPIWAHKTANAKSYITTATFDRKSGLCYVHGTHTPKQRAMQTRNMLNRSLTIRPSSSLQ